MPYYNDTESIIILYSQAVNGHRNDMKFAMASTRATKNIDHYIFLQIKHMTQKKLRTCINEEIGAEDQIPTRGTVKRGSYRKSSIRKFKKEIYNKRSHVEGVFSVIKRKFGGINKSRSTQLQNKETKFKTTIYNITQLIKLL